MQVDGFYRFNGVDEESSKKGVKEVIVNLTPKINELFGSFKYKILEVKQLEEDINYYKNEDKCFRVYFTTTFDDSVLKKDNLKDIGLYFYTEVKIKK